MVPHGTTSHCVTHLNLLFIEDLPNHSPTSSLLAHSTKLLRKASTSLPKFPLWFTHLSFLAFTTPSQKAVKFLQLAPKTKEFSMAQVFQSRWSTAKLKVCGMIIYNSRWQSPFFVVSSLSDDVTHFSLLTIHGCKISLENQNSFGSELWCVDN